jgi:ribosome biogenesis GTPase A
MTDSGEFDARPVRAFLPGPDVRVDESVWPASVPALAQVLRDGLELPAGLTVLVGENGSGKSTVVETLAEAYGLNPQGGSAMGRGASGPRPGKTLVWWCRGGSSCATRERPSGTCSRPE